MGIHDRDYYRAESKYLGADARVQACVVLTVIYVSVFLLQLATREENFAGQLGQSPVTALMELRASKVMEGEVWRVFTYAFVHDPNNIFPIAFNILFLVFFGRHVEDIYGWKEFLAYYLCSGVLAGLAFVLASTAAQNGGALFGPAASVTATLFLYALHFPRRTILLFFVIPCPVWFVVVFNVLNDVVGFFGGRLHPAAFVAHAAAAGFAYVYFHYSLRVVNWLPGLPSGAARRKKSKPKLHLFEGTPDDDLKSSTAGSGIPAAPAYASAHAGTSGGPTPSTNLDEHLEAKLDEVLEKVKKHGQESLSEDERAVLFRASEIYRKRRKSGGA